ncbi:peptidoglycan DD-metalloendopeptidase family protein [Stenotrophomonas maltophilia]|nr:peptidoglycan DD-metalloendopeptidase family protein [Stenotrophomonas maltophilia]
MSLSSTAPWMISLAASLLGAGLAWYGAQSLQRLLRLSHASTRFWLGAWLCAVLPPLLALLLPVQAAPLQKLASALPVALDSGTAVLRPVQQLPALAATEPLMAWLTPLLLTVYIAGVMLTLVRWALASGRLRALLRRSHPLQTAQLPGPQSHHAVQGLQQEGVALRIVEGSGTPFALCRPQPQIILPTACLALPDRTLRLVIGHEAAHLQRRDPQRAALMWFVGALYWFNPFVRRIAARMQLAAELQCDARALAEGGAANDGRLLAHAYVQTLRYATAVQPTSALTHRDLGGHQVRLQHMLKGDNGRRPGLTSVLLLLALGSACTVGVATVQATVVAGPTPVTLPLPIASVTLVEATLPPPSFFMPLSNARVTSVFGHVADFRQSAHHGTDFAARRGTAVLAPADGTVIAATHAYPDGANYGTVVVIDHGGGWQSLFAHLQDFAVQPGQQVRRGDPIARSGNTGRTTGPHLHMELLRNGTRVDPQHWLQ